MADKDIITAWQPRYIRQTIANAQGELVTVERWNELWNLNINQGDDTSAALKSTVNVLLEDITNLSTHKTSTDHDSRYYTETEMDSKLLVLNTSVNADIAALASHKTGTDHDVRYFTKAQLSNSGQATVDWNNVTNKPNFADATWKTAVANKAALPLVGNTLGDQRMVLDDGDGKSALYTCVATSGTTVQQWTKIGDVDWNSEETTRVAQENERKASETVRVNNETTRVTNETNRVAAESVRVTNNSNYTNAETSRAASEVTRNSAETTRLNNETARVTAENARLSAETNRVSAEPIRISNENTRISNESTRVSSELLRIANESTRDSSESTRVTSEAARVSAESTRVSEFNTIKSEWATIVQADVTAEVIAARGSYANLDTRLDASDALLTTAGTSPNYTAVLPGFALATGKHVTVKFHSSSAVASTLNVEASGAKALKKSNGNNLTNIPINSVMTFVYDGTNFQLQGEGASGNAVASDLLSGKTASTDAGEITGTMPNNGSQTASITTSGGTKVIPAGYTTGGTVTATYPDGTGKKGYASGTQTTGTVIHSGISVNGLNFTPRVILWTSNVAPQYGTGFYNASDTLNSKYLYYIAMSDGAYNYGNRVNGLQGVSTLFGAFSVYVGLANGVAMNWWAFE